MPFSFTEFRALLRLGNLMHSRETSSLSALEDLLQRLGAGVGPDHRDEIQALWVRVPHEKQVQYRQAIDYLKRFVPGLADAIPVNPRMEYRGFKVHLDTRDGRPYPMRFYHSHVFSYDSSNGNLRSLTNVGTRERVRHRTDPNGLPFGGPGAGRLQMEFTQGATTNSGAAIGYCPDDHSVPNPAIALAFPLSFTSVIADQTYEYTTDGTTWKPIEGARYEIEKGVRGDVEQPVFFFRKQSAPPHMNAFHFEVEYPIGSRPTWPIVPPPVAAALWPESNIRDYAVRVVRWG